MEAGTIIAASAAGVAGLGLIFTAVSVYLNAREMARNRRIRTLEYVTNQFDRLASLGAREEMRKMRGKDILSYIGHDKAKGQRLLEYVYTFNRIGAAIAAGALSEDVLFNIWTPKWFQGHWSRFKPFIEREKARRGEEAAGAYAFFEWLAEKKCSALNDKYPDRSIQETGV